MTQVLSSPQQEIARRALNAWDDQQSEIEVAIAQSILRHLELLSGLDLTLKSKSRVDLKDAESLVHKQASHVLDQAQEHLLDLIGLQGQLRNESHRFALSVLMDAEHQKRLRKRGAVLGGVLSGMASGIAADLMVGGLSLGGGILVGGIVGALGGAGVAESYGYLSQNDQSLKLSHDALQATLRDLLFFVLCASAHGRAKGAFIHHSRYDTSLNPYREEASDWSQLASSTTSDSMKLIMDRCHQVISELEGQSLTYLDERLLDLYRSPKSQEVALRQVIITHLTEVIRRGLRAL